MITPQQIYDATSGGLDIIKYYYPSAVEKKAFRTRDERTPSTWMKKFGDVWKCTDFGDDSQARNAIDICMREENLTFPQALYTLAGRYGVTDNSVHEANRPEVRQRPAEGDEKPGDFSFEEKDFTERELKILGPRVKAETCREYGYRSLASYSITKADEKTGEVKTTTVRSTDTYPIFMRECAWEEKNKRQTFYKIYQPLNFDKARRFFYIGQKPANYINGLAELKAAAEKFEAQQAENDENSDDDDTGKNKNQKKGKYPEAVICSGERDALCCAALGYRPLWFNSETYRLSEAEYRQISSMVEIVYNVPDIDETGIRKGVELAMEYLEVRTVWLPDWLKTYCDARGKHRKDLRDYTELRPDTRSFKQLLETAMPMSFWESVPSKNGLRYEINSEYLLHHLQHNGFGNIENKNEDSGQSLIRIERNVVREIYPMDIRRYLRGFMKERNMSIDLRNLLTNSGRIKNDLFGLLHQSTFDFTDFDHDRQLMFFKNVTWEVTAEGVAEHRTHSGKHVWADEIIPHDVKRLASAFSITLAADGNGYGIEVKNTQSKYFSYLINASRIYWREELEHRLEAEAFEGDREQYRAENKFVIDGKLLTEEEIDEQKHHLVNKIFAIGYLLHRQKMRSRSWCVYAMDWMMSDDPNDSNGRSGKSFCFSTLKNFIKTVILEGQDLNMTTNKHVFERVTEHTDYVLVDDADRHLNFKFFYNRITGDWIINPKNNRSYEIPYEHAPKMCITTNHAPKSDDPSTQARLLYTVFSDWYHEKAGKHNYRETRTIRDDFGMELHGSLYSAEDWNRDINFLADCLQFYLTTFKSGRSVKINPPMKNVMMRIYDMKMREPSFQDWALTYFSPESGNTNKNIIRKTAIDDFHEIANLGRKWTPKIFMDALDSFCLKHGYTLNPKCFLNSQRRNTKTIEGKTHDMIYVQTGQEINAAELINHEGEIPVENMPF
jgi:hypothetical protein